MVLKAHMMKKKMKTNQVPCHHGLHFYNFEKKKHDTDEVSLSSCRGSKSKCDEKKQRQQGVGFFVIMPLGFATLEKKKPRQQ